MVLLLYTILEVYTKYGMVSAHGWYIQLLGGRYLFDKLENENFLLLLICLRKILCCSNNIFMTTLSYSNLQMITLIFDIRLYIISTVIFAAKAKNPCFRIISSNRIFDVKQMGNAIFDTKLYP